MIDQKREKLFQLLSLFEKVLKERKITKDQYKDEFDQFLNNIFQGKDIVNAYERRACGVKDEEWDAAIKNFRETMPDEN